MIEDNTETDSAASEYLQLPASKALENKFEIAGMGARAHAFIIDWHIRLLLALFWLLASGTVLFFMENEPVLDLVEISSATALIVLTPAVIIYFFYHPALEILMSGSTPGKRMAGVRLVNLQGNTPGIPALLLRNVLRLVDALPIFYFLGLLAVALTRNHVRVGDLAAGLVLIYDDSVKPNNALKISQLAMKSRLSEGDTALLLELLNRWNELSSDTRLCLAKQFFSRIGKPVPNKAMNSHKQGRELKRALENLLTNVHNQASM